MNDRDRIVYQLDRDTRQRIIDDYHRRLIKERWARWGGLVALLAVFIAMMVVLFPAHAQMPPGFQPMRHVFTTPQGDGIGIIRRERVMTRVDGTQMRIRTWDVVIADQASDEYTGLYAAEANDGDGFACVTTGGECLPLVRGDIESVTMYNTGEVFGERCVERNFFGECEVSVPYDLGDLLRVADPTPVEPPFVGITRVRPSAYQLYHGELQIRIDGGAEHVQSMTVNFVGASNPGGAVQSITVPATCENNQPCAVSPGYCPPVNSLWAVTVHTAAGDIDMPWDAYWKARPSSCVP